MVVATAISNLPHSTWVLVVVISAALGLMLAFKLGSVAGFLVKNVVALVIFVGAVFFLAPAFLGQARGEAFQDHIRQTLHLSQAKTCATTVSKTTVAKSAGKLADCAKAAKSVKSR